MFERFTADARQVIVLAQREARTLNHNYIGTEHLLLAVIQQDEGEAAKSLESLGISLEGVRTGRKILGQGEQAPSGHIPFTLRAKKGSGAEPARVDAAGPRLHRCRAHPARPH